MLQTVHWIHPQGASLPSFALMPCHFSHFSLSLSLGYGFLNTYQTEISMEQTPGIRVGENPMAGGQGGKV
jgi:hypothetical protein